MAKVRGVPPVVLAVATFGFVGLSPVASGTFGSLAAVAFYYFIPFLQNGWVLVAAIVAVFIVGAISADVIELRTGEHDPGVVVIDEVLGQWIALLSFWYHGDIVFISSAFVLFRIFDIFKPYPAKIFERSIGGTSIMLDDAIAGVYACIAGNVITYLYYSFL
jgi:phosphatidylglycerophosphatase A